MSAPSIPDALPGLQTLDARAALAESGMLQSLPLRVLDDTPLGVIIWDGVFRVAEWNKAAGRIFGWDRESAQGQHASFIIPAAYRSHVDDVFRSLLRAEGGTHSVNSNITRDGSAITCEWHNTPLRRDDKTVIGVISLVHDISERQRLEEELRQIAAEREARVADAQREAEQKSRMISEMNAQLATIQRQNQQIVALSAPLLDVWHGVLAVPLIGNLDHARMAEIMERLLASVTERRVQFVILDLTGIDNVDTNNAAQIIKILSALRLLGATGIVTGIHPVVAQTVVMLGLDLRSIVTLRSLQEALRYCMSQKSKPLEAEQAHRRR